MTVVSERATSATRAIRHRIVPRRDTPLVFHLFLLALVLLALVPVVGTGASFSADEGAVIAQARSLSKGDGWIVEHPVPEADPSGTHYPLELSARGPKGVAPFAKHPLYPVLLAGADRLGGVSAMVALSLLGTLAAAGLAALLARRIDPVLARPTLWVTGLATPLLFDGFVVIAHTLGAAAGAAAVLSALAAIERRSRWAVVGVAAAIGFAVLLRSEAVLFAFALATVCAVAALVSARRWRYLVVGSASVLAAGAGLAASKVWARSIVGGAVTSTGGGAQPDIGFLAARAHSFALTWLRPSYGDAPTSADIALVVMLAALALGVFAARRHPTDGTSIAMLAGMAAASSLAALVAAPTNLVPGLLVAFPLGAAGLFLLSREALSAPATRMVAGVFAVFAAAVAATQYATGGSGEWGGRYFSMGLPLLVPVALHALSRQRARVGARTFERAALALSVCSLAMATMALGSIRSTHQFTGRLVAAIGSAGKIADPAGKPVIVTADPAMPRLAWPTFDRQRWLLARSGEIGDLAGRLRAGGVRQMVLVSGPGSAELGAGLEVVATDKWAARKGWRVEVVTLPGP
ncbi:MAG: hypothetical protein ACRD1K_07210 [Acidimicrobiales bacterium]